MPLRFLHTRVECGGKMIVVDIVVGKVICSAVPGCLVMNPDVTKDKQYDVQ